jgi:hypothetical protein
MARFERKRFTRARALATAAGASLAAIPCLPGAAAQSGGPPENVLQAQRLIDEQRAEQRRATAPLNALLDWQWGGWIDYYIFHFDDGVQSQRVLQRPGLNLWTRMRIDDGAHEIFARMKLNFDYYNPGDEEDQRQQDWIGPNLDRGWYQIDVGRAFRLNSPSDPLQLKVRVGRQETQFGTGLAFDMPTDSVQLYGKIHDFRIDGLIGKTIASTPNIDGSESVDTHSNRCLFGVQVRYEGFDHHVPFAYALWNNDKTDERPQDPYQQYSYDTQYFGFGSRGQIIPNLNYWGEFVFEQGHSYMNTIGIRRNHVDAWAWDAGLEYLFQCPMRPRIAAEYIFASGDSQRVYSPTDSGGGIGRDLEDSSFSGFGYRDTGLSAAPEMSNIHIWKAGGSLAPLESIELFRDMELGTNWFLYHKHHSRGAISDGTAGMYEGFVGWEMDYFVNWRLTSDVSWTIRWGMFFPGSAFQDRDERSFLFTGVTWSF